MRIAFFGSSLVSAYWNGAATYYRGILRGLAHLGHEITFYEPDAFDRQQNRDIADPEWARVVVYPALNTEALDECLKEAKYADVLIKASGVGVFDQYLERKVAQADGITLFWDVDAPATLDRVLADEYDPFRKSIPEFSAVFTYGGGPKVAERYAALGARACHPIYNAADLDSHYSVEPDEDFRSDLSLTANRLPDREERIEEFFFKPASKLPHQTFLLGGSGWGGKMMPEAVRWIGHVGTNQHNKVNCSSKAVLNVTRASMADYGFSPPTRIFEAAAARACIITDTWEGIESFFRVGEEILTTSNGEEVATILQGLSTDDARRIGEAAYKRLAADHTYVHRAAEVDRLLRGLTKDARDAVPVLA